MDMVPQTVELQMEMVTLSKKVAAQLDIVHRLTKEQWDTWTILGRVRQEALPFGYGGFFLVARTDDSRIVLVNCNGWRLDVMGYPLIIIK